MNKDKKEEERESNEISIKIEKSILGKIFEIIGVILLMVGCFLPLYKIALFGLTISYIDGDGIFILLLSVIIIILILCKKQKFVVIPLVFTLIVLIYDFLNISKLKDFGSLQIGFYCILLGFVICVIGTAYSIKKEGIGKPTRKQVVLSIMLVFALIVGGSGVKIIQKVKEKADKYAEAAEYMDEKEYDDAISIYKELGDYKKSNDKLQECRYFLVKENIKRKDFDDARTLLGKLGDYKDSKKLLLECDYQEAKSYMEYEDYEEAIKIFKALGNYEDSVDMIKACNVEQIKDKYFFMENLVSEVKEIMEIKNYEPGKQYCLEKIQEKVDSCLKNNEYNAAIEFLEKVSDYIDITDLLKECKYKKVKALYKNKKYDKALNLVKEILDYKNAKDFKEKIEKSKKNSKLKTPVLSDIYDSTDYFSQIGDGTSCRGEWIAISGADGYEVHYSELSSGETYEETIDTEECFYEVSASDTIYIEMKVRAYKYVDGVKKYSDWSQIKAYTLNEEYW